MKTNRLVMCSVLILGSLFAQPAWADTIVGKVTSLGTVSQSSFPDRSMTAFEIGVHSTCNGTPTDLSIRVFHTSFVANPNLPDSGGDVSANFRNAYSTLLAALLAGNSVQIDGQVSCNSAPQNTNFLTLGVAIIAEP